MHLGGKPARLQPTDKCIVRPYHLALVPLLRWLDHDCFAVQLDQYHDVLIAAIKYDWKLACLVTVQFLLQVVVQVVRPVEDCSRFGIGGTRWHLTIFLGDGCFCGTKT